MSEREHLTEVWGQKVPVQVYRQSKSVFIASGDYLGKSITVKGRSAGQAISAWREAARYSGN